MAEPKRRCRERLFCPHCEKYLSNSAFYRHKSSFYNQVSGTWRKRGEEERRSDTCKVDAPSWEVCDSNNDVQMLESSDCE